MEIHKNHELFLNCFKNGAEKSNKKLRAFIVGDGETYQRLEEYCRTLNLDYTNFTADKRKAPITFTSWITNVDWLLAGCDIVCLTSFNEGTPVSLIEAQAAGKPVITTNVGGVRDVVSDKTGFLVTDFNKDQFSEEELSLWESYKKEYSNKEV